MCERVNLGNGQFAIACGGHRQQKQCKDCGALCTKLCDFPLSGDKAGKTCDRPMCDTHSVHVDVDTDYCFAHARMVDRQQSLVGKSYKVIRGKHAGHVMRILSTGASANGVIFACQCSCFVMGKLEEKHLVNLDLDHPEVAQHA